MHIVKKVEEVLRGGKKNCSLVSLDSCTNLRTLQSKNFTRDGKFAARDLKERKRET